MGFNSAFKGLRITIMTISLGILVSQNQGRLDERDLWRAWERRKFLTWFAYET